MVVGLAEPQEPEALAVTLPMCHHDSANHHIRWSRLGQPQEPGLVNLCCHWPGLGVGVVVGEAGHMSM